MSKGILLVNLGSLDPLFFMDLKKYLGESFITSLCDNAMTQWEELIAHWTDNWAITETPLF